MEQLQSQIREWLENPADFSAGLTLLAQVCKNRHLVKAIARAQSKYNIDKMKGELRKALQDAPLTEAPESEAEQGSHADSILLPPAQLPLSNIPGSEDGQNHFTEMDDANVVLNQNTLQLTDVDLRTPEEHKTAAASLEVSLSRMHNKKGMLSNSLLNFAASDTAGRKLVLEQIDDIQKSMNRIRAALAVFNKSGKLPPHPSPTSSFNIKEKDIPSDPIQLSKRLTNERSNRSKLKRKLEGLSKRDEKKKPELEARLVSKDSLIIEIERRLGNGGN